MLELELNFCPSTRNLNKNKLAYGVFHFVCFRKLKECFFFKKNGGEYSTTNTTKDK